MIKTKQMIACQAVPTRKLRESVSQSVPCFLTSWTDRARVLAWEHLRECVSVRLEYSDTAKSRVNLTLNRCVYDSLLLTPAKADIKSRLSCAFAAT